MSIVNMYQQFGVETADVGHKKYRPGWINIDCPFCSNGSGKFHLGFNLNGNYFYCWQCGSHRIEAVLTKLFKASDTHVEELISTYRLKQRSRATDAANAAAVIKIGRKRFKLPSETGELRQPHIKYLVRRGFDPVYLSEVWGVMGTSPFSTLDKISYKYRILLPILWNGKPASFQARDYTNKQTLKYLACPMEREVAHHKHILYGHPSLWKARKGILVEGAFDVWRFKEKACGTMGIGYTPEQVRLLGSMFTKLVIMFDPEPVAQQRAKKLQAELSFRGVKTIVYGDLPTDPGALTQSDADAIVKELKL